MAVLGKDIFDLYRPHTHTKIQFGDKGYWVEWGTDCLPYGSILTEILNCSITDYCRSIGCISWSQAPLSRLWFGNILKQDGIRI